MNLIEKIKDLLTVRRQAYLDVFNPNSETVKKVMEDLAKFCRANDSTFHENERVHALLEGRREVFLRILYHTKLSSDQYMDKYGKNVQIKE